jgi:hypothetical protein
LSTDEVLISQQTAVGENTTSSSISLKNGTAYLNDKELATKDDVSVDTSNLVDLTSDQTITGTKTFNYIKINGSNLAITNNPATVGNSGNTAVGISTSVSSQSTTVGGSTSAGQWATSVGYGATAKSGGLALGFASKVRESDNASPSMALGMYAEVSAKGSIQIGRGINSTTNTLQVFNYQLLDADGKIPNERLNITFDTATTDEIDALFT